VTDIVGVLILLLAIVALLRQGIDDSGPGGFKAW